MTTFTKISRVYYSTNGHKFRSQEDCEKYEKERYRTPWYEYNKVVNGKKVNIKIYKDDINNENCCSYVLLNIEGNEEKEVGFLSFVKKFMEKEKEVIFKELREK